MTDPVIPYADTETLDPEARAMLDRMAAMTGFVPNSMRTYFHRPAIGRAVMGMFAAVYQDGESTLPPAIKGRIGIICSAINGCAYCTSHQCHAAAHPPGGTAGLSDQELSALVSGADQGRDAVEAACFAYARAASFDPGSVTPELLERLKEVLTSAQIVELAALVGLWKMINTIHDTLHLPIEEGMQDYARFLEFAEH
jgi:uncharacterized peroxidase-related enzyme